MILKLRHILERDDCLRTRLEQRLYDNSQDNPDLRTNPVRSLDDLYKWLDSFLSSMPWEGLMKSNVSIFKRIDQATGYFYYLFQDIQYEPSIAAWIKNFNYAWGEFLDSPASWNDEYYNMLRSDPLFELDTDKYESPDNWHSFNDFFARDGELWIHETFHDRTFYNDLLDAEIVVCNDVV